MYLICYLGMTPDAPQFTGIKKIGSQQDLSTDSGIDTTSPRLQQQPDITFVSEHSNLNKHTKPKSQVCYSFLSPTND